MNANKIMQSIFESLRLGGTLISFQLRPEIQAFARPLLGAAAVESILFHLPPLYGGDRMPTPFHHELSLPPKK